MFEEKRKTPRINTHIIAKLTDRQTMEQYYGYIENISEGGLGVASTDHLFTRNQLGLIFCLPNLTDKILPIVSLVFTKRNIDMINYYGFSFEYLSEFDRRAIGHFVESDLKSTITCDI